MQHSPSNESNQDPATTRFGIIGTGRITRRLVADLQSTPNVAVTSIASRSGERANWYASQYGIASPVEGYDALLQRDDVDAVYISLPPSMHHEWAIRAAQAKKHVLCEKPLALCALEAMEIQSTCESQGVDWLDATGWLHHQRTIEMSSLVRGGELGKLGHISTAISFYRPFQTGEHRLDPKLGGGCLLDLGWYTVGVACFFAGRMPHRVYASSIDENGVPIRMNANLWFDEDLTATLSCGYDTSTRKWFEVAGSEATLTCDDFSRPWLEGPTRYSVRDAKGNNKEYECGDRQEQSMIRRFITGDQLQHYNELALRTQTVLDALAKSTAEGRPISFSNTTTQ